MGPMRFPVVLSCLLSAEAYAPALRARRPTMMSSSGTGALLGQDGPLFLGKAEKNWKVKEKNVKDEEGKVTRRGDRHLFCVEDPFEVTHDLGRVMDRDTLRDVRAEIDRAHVMLSERRSAWSAVCEQFVDPNPKTKGRGANPDAKGAPQGGNPNPNPNSASASPALGAVAAPQTDPPPVALD